MLKELFAVKYKDGAVKLFKKRGCMECVAAWEPSRPNKPRRNQKQITLNCWQWRLVWIDEQNANTAYKEYYRTKGLSAFNIIGEAKRRKLNQHAKRYDFLDGSALMVYDTTNRMTCFNTKGEPQAERVLFGG